MTTARVTFTLEGGDIPLEMFVRAMRGFADLIGALDVELNREREVSVVVEDLAPGSTTATVVLESRLEENVDRLSNGLRVVSRSLANSVAIPFASPVRKAANAITSVLDGNVTAVRFDTEGEVSRITTTSSNVKYSTVQALGAVEGVVETLTRRNRIGFTLYDSIWGRAVVCFLKPEQAELARDSWGRRVLVSGLVQRDRNTGRALRIDQIREIRILDEVEPGSFRAARGVLINLGDVESSDLVRSFRDVE